MHKMENKFSIYINSSEKIASSKTSQRKEIIVRKLFTQKFVNSNFYKPISKIINFHEFR